MTIPVGGRWDASDTGVFGFTYEPLDAEAGDHETFSVGGRPAGGIGGLAGGPPGTPSRWLPYFSVADTDTATTAAGDGGGTVLMSPETTPFGRIGMMVDPFGGVFGVHSVGR